MFLLFRAAPRATSGRLPSGAERGVGPHDRMSAGDDAPALDFVLEIYPLFETAGKGCQNGWSLSGRGRGVAPDSGFGFGSGTGGSGCCCF